MNNQVKEDGVIPFKNNASPKKVGDKVLKETPFLHRTIIKLLIEGR